MSVQNLYNINGVTEPDPDEDVNVNTNGDDNDADAPVALPGNPTIISPKLSDLCSATADDLKFFIFRTRLYVFYKTWVWPFNLNIKQRKSEEPQLIRSWLKFLPQNFTGIDAIYERPNGEIALFSDNNIYMFNPDTITLKPNYPMTYQKVFGKDFKYNGIQSAVLTNAGKTYIFYKSLYVIEIDECRYQPKKFILINELLKGVPISTSSQNPFSIFKYTNGKLYIMQNNNFYEYDEFSSNIVRSGPFDLSLFNINCISDREILTNFKNMVEKLVQFYDEYNKNINSRLTFSQKNNNINKFNTEAEIREHILSHL